MKALLNRYAYFCVTIYNLKRRGDIEMAKAYTERLHAVETMLAKMYK